MKCGQPCEIYSRIVGYYRPLQDWNVGKISEFEARKTYDIDASDEAKLIEENKERIAAK